MVAETPPGSCVKPSESQSKRAVHAGGFLRMRTNSGSRAWLKRMFGFADGCFRGPGTLTRDHRRDHRRSHGAGTLSAFSGAATAAAVSFVSTWALAVMGGMTLAASTWCISARRTGSCCRSSGSHGTTSLRLAARSLRRTMTRYGRCTSRSTGV